jgi:aminoglycoside phosphotransferase family enzyme
MGQIEFNDSLMYTDVAEDIAYFAVSLGLHREDVISGDTLFPPTCFKAKMAI